MKFVVDSQNIQRFMDVLYAMPAGTVWRPKLAAEILRKGLSRLQLGANIDLDRIADHLNDPIGASRWLAEGFGILATNPYITKREEAEWLGQEGPELVDELMKLIKALYEISVESLQSRSSMEFASLVMAEIGSWDPHDDTKLTNAIEGAFFKKSKSRGKTTTSYDGSVFKKLYSHCFGKASLRGIEFERARSSLIKLIPKWIKERTREIYRGSDYNDWYEEDFEEVVKTITKNCLVKGYDRSKSYIEFYDGRGKYFLSSRAEKLWGVLFRLIDKQGGLVDLGNQSEWRDAFDGKRVAKIPSGRKEMYPAGTADKFFAEHVQPGGHNKFRLV